MSHTRMTTLTGLNKADNSHSFDACFHILVHRCNINVHKVLFFLYLDEKYPRGASVECPQHNVS